MNTDHPQIPICWYKACCWKSSGARRKTQAPARELTGPDYVEIDGRVRYDLLAFLEFIGKDTSAFRAGCNGGSS